MGTRRALLVLACLAVVMAALGCGPAATRTAATGDVHALASAADCAPRMQIDAEEVRQALCETPAGRFVLLSFASDGGERSWLDVAEDYGGHYLVGPRWIAVGDLAVVTALRDRLGGTVERGVSHH